MSADLRRRIAYFGPREKVYGQDADSEVPGLPKEWRRVLSMAWPCTVAGPCGNLYADTEHAIAAFRAHYTTNNPALAQLYRPEHEPFNVWRVCRRWSTNNGFSLLLSEPDERVWFVIRDRCMFDLVYQRVCRDSSYRHILATLVDSGYVPVYHVRTADAHTYWGATLDRNKIILTQAAPAQAAPVDLDDLAKEKAHVFQDDPSTLLVGKNRLGVLMVSALEQFRRVYENGTPLRARVLTSVSSIPAIPLSPLSDVSRAPEAQPPTLSACRSTSSSPIFGEEDGTSVETASDCPTPMSKKRKHPEDGEEIESIIDDLFDVERDIF